MRTGLLRVVIGLLLLACAAPSVQAQGEWRAVRPIPIRKLQPPDGATYPQVQALVRGVVEELAQEAGLPKGKTLRVHVAGHGRESSAEDIWQNVITMARVAGADAAVALDFPELRGPGEELTWHWRSIKAGNKTALAVAALNAAPGAEVWSMRGESAMAENIVRMYDMAAPELKPLIRVSRNIVMDSYPFAQAPFMPKEIPAGFLAQVGGTVYLNFTKFGHWSNPLKGGPKLVNICVAPGGQAVSHGWYEVVEESRLLEELEISGASRERVEAFARKIGTCRYFHDLLDGLSQTELPNGDRPSPIPRF
ncbi:MAG TPA: hypothetical protein DCM05_06540 [Elusimicrobia bacterium]|nr:hypothetical protein [Elusimicrobiota bacterium]